MFILEEPYVSDFLKKTAVGMGLPILDNTTARRVLAGTGLKPTPEDEFIRLASETRLPLIYSNSENAIDWVGRNLSRTTLPDQIERLKNKIKFREILKEIYPEYVFQGLDFKELDKVDPSKFNKPFIVKPAVGFFSLGVHKVHKDEDWTKTVKAITEEVRDIRRMYPEQVLDVSKFIIEECINGQEFAVDAYFDTKGEPVILDILGHLFASENDVSDRVYYTSATLIRKWETAFRSVLGKLGRLAGLTDFPVHAELRVDDRGNIAFIEVNPMRFAGWCCTDLAHFAYDLNPYEYFLEQKKPNWDQILKDREGKAWSLVVADMPSSINCADIVSVDYEALAGKFSKLLELRKVDYAKYSVLGFLFVETAESDMSELEAILQSDLMEFCTFR